MSPSDSQHHLVQLEARKAVIHSTPTARSAVSVCMYKNILKTQLLTRFPTLIKEWTKVSP